MALDFLPFEEGQTITPEDLNALVGAIQDGSIFVGTSFVGDLVSTLGDRVTALEARTDVLEAVQAKQRAREQFSLTAGQSVINIAKVPLLDSESVSLNGINLSKTGLPVGFVGDFSLSGSVITINTELAATVEVGDILIVMYDFEVV